MKRKESKDFSDGYVGRTVDGVGGKKCYVGNKERMAYGCWRRRNMYVGSKNFRKNLTVWRRGRKPFAGN